MLWMCRIFDSFLVIILWNFLLFLLTHFNLYIPCDNWFWYNIVLHINSVLFWYKLIVLFLSFSFLLNYGFGKIILYGQIDKYFWCTNRVLLVLIFFLPLLTHLNLHITIYMWFRNRIILYIHRLMCWYLMVIMSCDVLLW